MISIVLVSHSAKAAEGVKELADQMSQGKVNIYAAGGVDDNTIGTNAVRIHAALEQATQAEGVLLLVDMGSAVMSAEMAIEMLDEDMQAKITIADAPLIEGAIIASVEASIGNSLEHVKLAAEATRQMNKLS